MSALKDLTGQRFGRLVVIERAPNKITPKGQSKTMWKCICDCGNECVVSATNLRFGKTQSCGCLQKTSRLGQIRDLTGQKFGRLYVVERADDKYDKYGRHTMWRCVCDCGNETVVGTSSLTCGNTTSCGCYFSEIISEIKTTHGMSKSRLYNVWNGILTRCYNSKSTKYKNYGARGIKVCDEWHKFESFYDWAMSTGYDPKAEYGACTIERKNVNGDYEPSNCVWATSKQQANNTTTNHILEWNGEKLTMSQWADKTGIDACVISDRIGRGWDVEKTLTTPVKR